MTVKSTASAVKSLVDAIFSVIALLLLVLVVYAIWSNRTEVASGHHRRDDRIDFTAQIMRRSIQPFERIGCFVSSALLPYSMVTFILRFSYPVRNIRGAVA